MSKTEFYLQTPPLVADISSIEESLKQMLLSGRVSALLCHSMEAYDLAKPYAKDTALLLPYSDFTAEEKNMDGVHFFDTKADGKKMRSTFKDKSIGFGPIGSKHDAMVFGELGADYLAFSAGETELLEWWAKHFIVPCVAWGVTDSEHAKKVMDCGADFIMPAPLFWKEPLKSFEDLTSVL